MNTQTLTEKKVINIKDIEVGDVFSEESHYIYLGEKNGKHQLNHLESKQVVNFDTKYVTELLQTADQYDEKNEVEVGREDKYWTQKQIDEAKKKGILEADSIVREGDLKVKGIRAIWSDIHSTKVFTVCFDKKGKDLTQKAFKAAKEKQIKDALANISSGKVTLEDSFKEIQENPIFSVEKGEERILRGYKVQFVSTNGFYDVVDMDIPDDGKEGYNLRKVNINEIKWLVVDNFKYIVV